MLCGLIANQIQVWFMSSVSADSACLSAPESLAKSKGSGNLSQYVWEVRAKVSEMKMTRPYLIVVSICSLTQDVCLSVHLSLRPSVLLWSWRHVSCHWVETVAAVSLYGCWFSWAWISVKRSFWTDSIIITTLSLRATFHFLALQFQKFYIKNLEHWLTEVQRVYLDVFV